MERRVEAELLDELPADEPRAMRSRKDLQRINAWMGNAKIMATALRSAFDGQAPRAIVDLGAGDGAFLLRVARSLAPAWGASRHHHDESPENPKRQRTAALQDAGAQVHARRDSDRSWSAAVLCRFGSARRDGRGFKIRSSSASAPRLLLLDQQDLVNSQTREAFGALNCRVETLQIDVLDWLRGTSEQPFDAMVANLFLHHFPESQLAELLCGVANRARIFVAIEPRRSAWSLAFAKLVGLIGCNAVTRHDAVLSVRAGFAGRELSRLWPAAGDWSLEERPAGRFSHLFIAARRK